jgi:hypothetical protein
MSVRDAVKAEAHALKQCLDLGPVAVDIPIDLQNLLAPAAAEVIWELTHRPVDKKLRAMAPLADRIGAPVARFSAIMRDGGFSDRLGKDLFEAYPAENLRRLGFSGNYKAKSPEKLSEKHAECERLCRYLAIDREWHNDDDLDAIICAITAVASKDALASANELGLDLDRLPKGFRILKRNPFNSIALTEQDFSTWFARRGAALPA